MDPSERVTSLRRRRDLAPPSPHPLKPSLPRPAPESTWVITRAEVFLQGRMPAIRILGAASFIACLALRAAAQDAPIIFSNQDLLKDWPSESYASTAYSSEYVACFHSHVTYSPRPPPLPDSGCLSQQYAPTNLVAGIDSVVGIAVRVNLPLVGGYHTCGVIFAHLHRAQHPHPLSRLPTAATGRSPRSPCRSGARRFRLSRTCPTIRSSSTKTVAV